MSDFYLESQYLNLNKMYNNFSYTNQSDIGQDNISGIYGASAGDFDSKNNEGISQNKYQFIQEKDMLLSDVNNLCAYFKREIVDKRLLFIHLQKAEAKPNNFPFQKIKERICHIIQKYQEQAVLLDSVMEIIVVPTMNIVEEYLKELMKLFWEKGDVEAPIKEANKEENLICEEFHHLVSIIYLLCKVRGYKSVIRFFPHDVKDLEPVVFYLVSEREKQVALWDTKYVILLWLSIIILVPFDLESIDSKAIQICGIGIEDAKSKDLFYNLVELGKLYLKSSSRMREAAAILLSKFFTRPDIQKLNLLSDFLLWAQKTLAQIKSNPLESFFVTGIMSALVEIFKIGQREELLSQSRLVTPIILSPNVEALSKPKATVTESITLRLSKSKLAQRIGMIFLKPRVVKWAYKRGNKSLIENVKKLKEGQGGKLLTFNVGTNPSVKLAAGIPEKKNESTLTEVNNNNNNKINNLEYDNNNENNNNDDDDDMDIGEKELESLEGIIEHLLACLKDKDTVVRWSAAKGIGRITGRLPMEMANEIVSSVLLLFGPNEGEFSWHGGCLTIAELSRRGLLLPKRLGEIMPVINKALIYDQNQGNYSIGGNVRDAACYVAWAFARAYDPEILAPYVLDLAQSLLLTCLYDREVNCR